MMTRATAADLTVLALVGERGREVGDFLKRWATRAGGGQWSWFDFRSVAFASHPSGTAATSVAEYSAPAEKTFYWCLIRSLDFAMAQREIGLAAGEPPMAKGYTPSVLAMMARLIERAGRFPAEASRLLHGADGGRRPAGSIGDTARSLLDGHVVLDRNLALRNHYPAISVLDSLSRLMPAVCSPQQIEKAGAVRMFLAAHRPGEDLIRIGAYKPGTDALLDRAIAALPAINSFLHRNPTEIPAPAEISQRLLALPA